MKLLTQVYTEHELINLRLLFESKGIVLNVANETSGRVLGYIETDRRMSVYVQCGKLRVFATHRCYVTADGWLDIQMALDERYCPNLSTQNTIFTTKLHARFNCPYCP